jgi:hypothetical protein
VVVAVHGGNHLGRCRIYINDGRFVTEMERQDLNDAAEAVQPPSRRDLERSAAMAQDTFEASIDALLTDGYRVAFAILRHRQEAEDVLQTRPQTPGPSGSTSTTQRRCAPGS